MKSVIIEVILDKKNMQMPFQRTPSEITSEKTVRENVREKEGNEAPEKIAMKNMKRNTSDPKH